MILDTFIETRLSCTGGLPAKFAATASSSESQTRTLQRAVALFIAILKLRCMLVANWKMTQ
jgi:hypothetical protein